MNDTIKITHFAGLPVPEDGLTVHPPQGGELTIWPHGDYAFTPPSGEIAADGQQPVTTYYSYVMEDVDGHVSTATFALKPVDEVSHDMDSQAWSLPGILDAGDDAMHFLGVADADVGAGGEHASDSSGSFHGYIDVSGVDMGYEDELTQLIIRAQHT